MRNEDHLLDIVDNAVSETAVSEGDRKKMQYLARKKVAMEIYEKESEYVQKLGGFSDARFVAFVGERGGGGGEIFGWGVFWVCIPCFSGCNERRAHWSSLYMQWIGRMRNLDNRYLITPKETINCFANIESIANAHREMLAALKTRIESWTNTSTGTLMISSQCTNKYALTCLFHLVGDVYRDNSAYFKLYKPYMLNYPSLEAAFALQVARKPLFVMMVAEFEKLKLGSIETLYPLPTRKIEGLNVLLKELLRNTPKEHADYQHLAWVTKCLNDHEVELKKLISPAIFDRTSEHGRQSLMSFAVGGSPNRRTRRATTNL